MIAIALALTFQAGAAEPQAVRSLVEAVQAWDDCLDAAASKYEPSGEPADAVVSAAMFDCRPQDFQVQKALVNFALANSDTMSTEDAVDRVLAERDSRLRPREQRLTQSIVAARLRARQVLPGTP